MAKSAGHEVLCISHLHSFGRLIERYIWNNSWNMREMNYNLSPKCTSTIYLISLFKWIYLTIRNIISHLLMPIERTAILARLHILLLLIDDTKVLREETFALSDSLHKDAALKLFNMLRLQLWALTAILIPLVEWPYWEGDMLIQYRDRHSMNLHWTTVGCSVLLMPLGWIILKLNFKALLLHCAYHDWYY
jgi:hypothetical protein